MGERAPTSKCAQHDRLFFRKHRYPLNSVQIEFVGITRSFTIQPKGRQDRQSAGGSGMDARGSGISVLLARSPCAQKRSKTKKALDAKAWMQEAGPAQHLYFCSAKHNRCWDACPCCSLSFVVGASRTEHILDARRRHVKLSRRAYCLHTSLAC